MVLKLMKENSICRPLQVMQTSSFSNVKSLKLIFEISLRFQSYSSLKRCIEQSEACWIGRAKCSTDTPVNCKWVDLNNQAICTLRIFNPIAYGGEGRFLPHTTIVSAATLKPLKLWLPNFLTSCFYLFATI